MKLPLPVSLLLVFTLLGVVCVSGFVPAFVAAKAPNLQALPETVNPKTGQFVLLDFYAKWCSTCQQLAPQVKTLAESQKANLQVIHVDVDKAVNGELIERYNISSTPTYLLFSPTGKPVYEMRNTLSVPALEKQIKANVARCKNALKPC